MSELERLQLLRQLASSAQTDMVFINQDQDQIVTNRPSAYHPYGISIPHAGYDQLQVRQQQLPFFSRKYYSELDQNVLFRTHVKTLGQELQDRMPLQIRPFIRQHLVCPVQSLGVVDYKREQRQMEIEDTLSAVVNRQIIDLQKRFESRLDFTGNGYLRKKDSDFLPDFLRSSPEPKKDV